MPRYIPFFKAGAAALLQFFMPEGKGEQSTGFGTAVEPQKHNTPNLLTALLG